MMQSSTSPPNGPLDSSRAAASDAVPRMPEALTRQLQSLRRSLWWGQLAGAIGRAVAWLVIVVALDLAVDRYLRLSGTARTAGLACMSLTLCAAWYNAVWLRLRRRPTDAALCAAVEELLPSNDRVLLACVELVEAGSGGHQPESRSLIMATVRRAESVAQTVDFRMVLDRRRLAGRALLAGLALVTLGAFVVACVRLPLLHTWFQRNVQLADIAWPQQTYLRIVGAEAGHLRIARGAATTLRILVSAESTEVPTGVEAEYAPRRARPSQTIRRTGPHEFQLLLRGAVDPFQLRVVGNDATTEWLAIEPVEPPTLRSLELTLERPAYLGGARSELDPAQGVYMIPRGSVLHLRGQSSATLATAAIRNGATRTTLDVAAADTFGGTISGAALISGRYVLELRDRDGLEAAPPPSFVLDIQPDHAPQVEVDWSGASRLITPRARLAAQVRAHDQYGILSIRAEARRPLDDGAYERLATWPVFEAGKAAPGAEPTEASSGENSLAARRHVLGQAHVAQSLQVDLEPLQLVPGTTVSLLCVARDAFDLGEPNEGHSTDLLLRVVRDEELQTDLLNREKQQRQQLEQIVDDEESLLGRLLDQLPDPSLGLSPELAQELIEVRRQSGILESNLVDAADRLNALLTEARHNRLEATTAQLSERLGQRVVPTLRGIVSESIGQVHQALDQARQADQPAADVRRIWQQAIDDQQLVVKRLRTAVAELARVESFQEAVQLLHEIRVAQQEIARRVADERRERARQSLEQSGDQTPGEPVAPKPAKAKRVELVPANSAKAVREGSETVAMQQRVQRHWDDFELRCTSLVATLRESEAERADRLERTLSLGRERGIASRMTKMIEQLQQRQLDQADADATALVADLRELLQLLLNRRAGDENGNALQEELRRQFAEMLREQRKWSEQTRVVAAERADDGTWRRAERLAMGRIAAGEQQLATQAEALDQRLAEVDGAVVLTVAVRELRQHWTTLAKELALPRLDAQVVGRQKAVEELLAELAGVLRTEADANADVEESPQETPMEGDTPQTPLVSQLAELKLLRAAQSRLLRQTQSLDAQRETGVPTEKLQGEMEELARRQEEIERLVERLLMR